MSRFLRHVLAITSLGCLFSVVSSVESPYHIWARAIRQRLTEKVGPIGKARLIMMRKNKNNYFHLDFGGRWIYTERFDLSKTWNFQKALLAEIQFPQKINRSFSVLYNVHWRLFLTCPNPKTSFADKWPGRASDLDCRFKKAYAHDGLFWDKGGALGVDTMHLCKVRESRYSWTKFRCVMSEDAGHKAQIIEVPTCKDMKCPGHLIKTSRAEWLPCYSCTDALCCEERVGGGEKKDDEK